MALYPVHVDYFDGPSDTGYLRNYLNIIIRALNYLIDYVVGPNGGGGIVAITSASSPYTVAVMDQIIEADATLGAITVVVPITRPSGRLVTIVKTDTSANAVTINNGTSDVGALAFAAVGVNMQSNVVYSNGTALRLI